MNISVTIAEDDSISASQCMIFRSMFVLNAKGICGESFQGEAALF